MSTVPSYGATIPRRYVALVCASMLVELAHLIYAQLVYAKSIE